MIANRALSCLVVFGIFALSVSSGYSDDKTEPSTTPQGSVISLFNGKDLAGLYTYINDTKYEDPRGVFTVQDGLLRISGDGYGGITTKKSYRDYHMVVEFKWGGKTWKSRKDRTRDSGVLVHCQGADGAYGGNWPASLEAQIIEGGVGDFIVVGSKDAKIPPSLTADITKDRDGESVWHEGGTPKVFSGGRVNWYGRDPDWKDEIGFRGKDDVESPLGQWTRMEVVCKGDTITVIVNGVVVNKGYDVKPSEGKILIQTELAEMLVRRWEVRPLDNPPAPWTAADQQ